MKAEGDQDRGSTTMRRRGEPREEPDPEHPGPASYRYAIRVRGHLDTHWSAWLDVMTLTYEDGATRLEGAVVDQAALYGLLNKVQEMNLTVLALQLIRVPERVTDSTRESRTCPEAP